MNPIKPVTEKPCRFCGRLMPRKKLIQRLESVVEYAARKFCDKACAKRGLKAGVSEDDEPKLDRLAREGREALYGLDSRVRRTPPCGSARWWR